MLVRLTVSYIMGAIDILSKFDVPNYIKSASVIKKRFYLICNRKFRLKTDASLLYG